MTPTLYSTTHNIRDHGAEEGKLSTAAIQAAVDACHRAGGGLVLVPAGRYLTGTIVLRSKVELHLAAGAILEASENLDDYLTTFRPHGLVLCEDASDVTISGEGTINARGIAFYDPTQNHLFPEFDRMRTRQKEGHLPEGTFFTDGPIKRKPRPGMTLTFYHCSGVTLKDFTLLDTPSWAVRLAYCDDVLVRGLSIHNNLLIPNSDGVHCTASRNVRISDCDIRAGDDAIIVTGFALDEETPGFSVDEQLRRPFGNKTPYAENVTVANCVLQSRSAGIRVGYGQHPIRRCVFANLVIHGSNRGIGIFAHDASDIEDLLFTNITIETRLHNGQWWGHGEPIHLSAISRFPGRPAGRIRNVSFTGITATSEQGILLWCREESRLENIRFDGVSLRMRRGAETLGYGGNFDLRPAAETEWRLFEHDIPGLYAQFVDGLVVRDFRLTWDSALPAFFTHGIECADVTALRLDGFAGSANPNAPGAERIRLVRTALAE